jgi:hypothetical protein
LLFATAACTAQGDDRGATDVADQPAEAEPVLSLHPATACTTSCGCALGSSCNQGSCQTIDVFSPPPPTPPCAADCQCPAAKPYCNTTPSATAPQCQATRCQQSVAMNVLPPGGTSTYAWTSAGAGGTRVVLLGTKNGVPDETGQTVLGLSGSFVIGNPAGAAGHYERHISLRNASNVELCRSTSLLITLQ